MTRKTALLAATVLLGSAAIASAQTYNISITDACDTLALSESSGVVIGQSNASDCDTSAVAGYVGTVKKLSDNKGKNELIVGGDFGYGPTEAWTWTFNLKTMTATLTGNDNGTQLGPVNYSFTYTTGGSGQKSGLPSVTSIVLAHQH